MQEDIQTESRERKYKIDTKDKLDCYFKLKKKLLELYNKTSSYSHRLINLS